MGMSLCLYRLQDSENSGQAEWNCCGGADPKPSVEDNIHLHETLPASPSSPFWLECELSLTDTCICTLGLQGMVLVWNILKPLGGGTLLEEVGH